MGSKPSDHLPPTNNACSTVLWVLMHARRVEPSQNAVMRFPFEATLGGRGRGGARPRSHWVQTHGSYLLRASLEVVERTTAGAVLRQGATDSASRVANFQVTVGPAAAHHADVTHIAPGAAAAANSRIRLGLGHQLSTPYPSRGPYQRSPMA